MDQQHPSAVGGGGGGAAAAAAAAAVSSPTAAPAAVVVAAEKEAEIILPPPTALNPIPSLPAALRLDNQEQLVSLLKTNPFVLSKQQQPHDTTAAAAAAATAATATTTTTIMDSNFRQLLVFSTESLRTLIMRQVLSDPHTRVFKAKKKNWDTHDVFPLPKGLSIVGTRILSSPSSSSSGADGSNGASKTATAITVEGNAEVSLTKGQQQLSQSWDDDNFINPTTGGSSTSLLNSVDVVTYFLHPTDLSHTQNVIRKIKSWKKTSNAGSSSSSAAAASGSGTLNNMKIHHRIVYLPQPTALVHKLLSSTGISSQPNVSIHKLQMDLYPLETDLLSLEYDDALLESDVEGTPSTLVTTVARSILKLQDVVGPIPRIQSLGPLGEDVVRKLLNMTVDEYLASKNQPTTPTTSTATATTTASSSTTTTTTTTTSTTNTMGIGGGGDPPVGNSSNSPSGQPISGGDVAALLIMDRKVDWVTPMTTPLTYEGLIDEVVSIDCGFIKVDVNTINPDDDETEKKQSDNDDSSSSPPIALGINGSDTLFAEVRDQHVEKFGIFLQNQAKALRETHQNFTSQGKKRDLSEIHQFVKQIPVFTQDLRSLTNHIHLAELVKAFSEELIFRERWQTERSMIEGEICYDMLDDLVACQYPPMRFFRLMCLQSLCAGGIKSSRYDALRRDVVQTYGYEYLFVLRNLEKIGLLRRRETLWMDSASPFNTLRKSLILINAEVNTVEPDDVSYVSSGYAPVSVRLVQSAVQGWRNKEDSVLKELPGRLVDIIQYFPPEDIAAANRRPTGPSLGAMASEISGGPDTSSGARKKPTLIVMYVGGVTYMEIAALRFLSKRPSFPYHIICVTTKVINGSTLLRSLLN